MTDKGAGIRGCQGCTITMSPGGSVVIWSITVGYHYAGYLDGGFDFSARLHVVTDTYARPMTTPTRDAS